MATRTSSSTRARGGTSSRPANRRPQTRSAPRKGAKKPQGGGLPLPLRAFRTTWMGMANVTGSAVRKVGAAGRDKPRAKPATDALSSAERGELARLRRQLRQVQMERDILAKATAWFAAKSDKTFTPSSNS